MVSSAQISRIISTHFPKSSLQRVLYCTWGLFNENCIVELTNPSQKVVIRMYPKEGWKAKKEEYIYRLLKKTDIPVPTVFACDTSRTIIPQTYLILSFSEGKIMPRALRVPKKAIREMGRYLATIHSIPMKKFGWIIGDKITPGFSRWIDFMDYDFKKKVARIKKYGTLSATTLQKIKKMYQQRRDVLNIEHKPCLLHKDYHLQNIFLKGDHVSGIIDFEWAVGGHNELDISKSMLFMFEDNLSLKKEFLKGYLDRGHISREFSHRDVLYQFTTIIGNLSLAYRRKNTKSITQNKKRLFVLLKKMS